MRLDFETFFNDPFFTNLTNSLISNNSERSNGETLKPRYICEKLSTEVTI